MFVKHADTFMTLQLEIRTTESPLAQLLTIFLKIGFALFAAWAKICSAKNNFNSERIKKGRFFRLPQIVRTVQKEALCKIILF